MRVYFRRLCSSHITLTFPYQNKKPLSQYEHWRIQGTWREGTSDAQPQPNSQLAKLLYYLLLAQLEALQQQYTDQPTPNMCGVPQPILGSYMRRGWWVCLAPSKSISYVPRTTLMKLLRSRCAHKQRLRPVKWQWVSALPFCWKKWLLSFN